MRKAVLFDVFAYRCSYFNGEDEESNGYGCTHPENNSEGCYCHRCPLGIEAEQQDLTDRKHPDAVKEEIDWDGLCECGEVAEGEYLLVNIGGTASSEEKEALYSYERYMHRYNKKWLDGHGIANSLVG